MLGASEVKHRIKARLACRCKTITDNLDYEFDLMKRCTKSVEAASADYNTFYRTLKESANIVNHTLCHPQANFPLELTRHLSNTLVPSRMDSLKDLFAGIKILASKISLRTSSTLLHPTPSFLEKNHTFQISSQSLLRKNPETDRDSATDSFANVSAPQITVSDENLDGKSLDSETGASWDSIDVNESPFFKGRRQIILKPHLEVILDEPDVMEISETA